MPWNPLPDRDGPPPVPLGAVLDSVVGGLGAPSVDLVVLLHERWAEVVGEEVAPHATLLGLDGAKLSILVDGPAWASHLKWAENEIVERVRTILGRSEIEAVAVRVGRR